MRKRYSRTNRGEVSTPPFADRLSAAELRHLPVVPRPFYARDSATVARDLLGCILHHETAQGPRAGRIVEVEAYLGLEDLAAHASRGLTGRTKPLFGPPGHAYVYLIYGMYECLNLVAEPDGIPGCALIRALEPVTGVEAMRHSRPTARRLEDLCAGPGRLTIAMEITRRHNEMDVTHGELTVRRPLDDGRDEIAVSPRIGVNQCVDWPLRFYFRNNPNVSRR
ncbi:MAG: DNA-3-methyladenine glycosylase [Bryobacterales bacterium]|nr:DNA-3-methyladenine glycosylase [Bryobacterales bacterium]